MAKPIKTLELQYQMIQFLIMYYIQTRTFFNQINFLIIFIVDIL